ncbi:histidinol-phosphate transaminase [Flavimaricola marinus]|uniref:Histidinol-phosphate aminotransferase n=1 Tax=Flavimaricola marinus TaxID=1819565 RepID=A0A238L9S9_9RHOB|nr:histidinol-phosphate transaminase [Flavimaricola marinus]SMY06165.1 Histidinol-phosphate aminotransferase [Flavimaricola marinus]
MSRFWSEIVETLTPYTPGEQPRGQSLIKLNTNEHPYGPSPKVIDAIRAAADARLRLYPDPQATALRTAIGQSHGLGPDHVFVGNGSDEVLAHAFAAIFQGKGALQFADITYSFYRTYCRLYGVEPELIPLDARFEMDVPAFVGAGAGVVVANPNAPTGIALGLEQIEQVLRQNPDVVVLVDEAYVDFGAESAAALVPRYDNLLVVQTLSKSRGLAGLRVGFAIAQPQLIDGLLRIKDSFNSYPLDRLALAGAEAAWADREWFEQTRDQIIAERARMVARLAELGFETLPSQANFVFTTHPNCSAELLLAELRARGVLVRHFPQDRIAGYLRITVGTPEEGEALIAALAEILPRH